MRKLPTLIALCLLTSAVHAADNGFYLGAGVGASKFGSAKNSNDWIDSSDTGYKLIAGFRLLDSFALEASYLDFGKGSVSTPACPTVCPVLEGHVAATAVSGFAVGFLDFPLIDPFAKLGFASVDAKGVYPGAPPVVAKDKKTGVAWGAGVQAHFGSLAVRGEFEQYKLDSQRDLRQLSVSFLYTFL